MKVDKTKLLNILTTIKPGLNKNDYVEHGNNFIFTGKEIITYNDEIAISYPYESNLDCSVPADKFYKLISNINTQSFIMIQKDNNLEIRSSGLKAEILISYYKDIIELIKPSNIDMKWTKLPDNFKKGIELCLFSLSDNCAIRPGLECLFINHQQIISCDNYRMSQYTLSETLEHKFLLPGPAAKEVIKFNITHYYLSEAWIYFKTDENIVFCSRYKPSDEYPSTEGFLEVKGKTIILPKELRNNISTSAIMAEENINHNKKVTIIIKDSKIICRGENDIGYVESFIEIDSEENITFIINPLFFIQILNKSNTMIYNEERKRLLFESDNFKHVLMCWG